VPSNSPTGETADAFCAELRTVRSCRLQESGTWTRQVRRVQVRCECLGHDKSRGEAKVMVPPETEAKMAGKPLSEHITMVACVNAVGDAMPPFGLWANYYQKPLTRIQSPAQVFRSCEGGPRSC